MKTWDTIILGGGVIGLSLAWRLNAQGLRVLVIEKHEPAREASYAAGGMIASCDPHIPSALKPLVAASAASYPKFVRELREDSEESADLRSDGTIAFFNLDETPGCTDARQLSETGLLQLEPLLTPGEHGWLLPECSVDPRGLGRALIAAARHKGVDFVTGSPALKVVAVDGRAAGVRTTQSEYSAGIVVNCCGAWAGQIQPFSIPTRPVKGQMVCLVPAPDGPHRPLVRHVVRTPEVYIIPRSDGRILLGATVEEAGFDKQVDPDAILKLHRKGIATIPALAEMRIHDSWAGLRPGTLDNLPILGETSLPGYYAATGHYRDGIMLAPITAQVMTDLLTGREPAFDLRPFSPSRFK